MEKRQRVGGSSAFLTMDLFGPKDSPSSSPSSTLFGSVFGPPSTGLGRKQDLGSQYGDAKHGTSPDNIIPRRKGESSSITGKDRTSVYQNEQAQPCYFSSSIYYGGQEVYSPNCQTAAPQQILKRDVAEGDPNGSNLDSASRGNWWQGSLYY